MEIFLLKENFFNLKKCIQSLYFMKKESFKIIKLIN